MKISILYYNISYILYCNIYYILYILCAILYTIATAKTAKEKASWFQRVEYRDVNRVRSRSKAGVRSKGKVLPLEEAHLPPPMRSFLHSLLVFPLDLPFSSFRLVAPVLESYGYKLSVRLSTRSWAPTILQKCRGRGVLSALLAFSARLPFIRIENHRTKGKTEPRGSPDGRSHFLTYWTRW